MDRTHALCKVEDVDIAIEDLPKEVGVAPGVEHENADDRVSHCIRFGVDLQGM